MAKWVSGSDLRIDPVGYSDALKSGIEGYRFGQEIKDRRDQEELGSLMAGIPEAETSEVSVPNAVSRNLEETAKINTAGAIPTEGGENLQARVEAVGGMQRKKTTTSKDWKSWEEGIRAKAGSMGPEALQKANAHITSTKQASLRDNASAAMTALQTGDTATAKQALEEAYTSFPDGNRAEIDTVDGQLVAKVYNEDTDELVETKPITMQEIADIVRISEDPVAYANAVREAEIATAAATEDTRRFNVVEGRLTKADSDDMSIAQRTAAVAEGRAAIEKLRSGVQNAESRQRIKQIVANMEEVVSASKRADKKTELDAKTYDEGKEQRAADLARTETDIDKMKVDMKIEDAQLKLQQIENIQGGAQRELERKKTMAEIAELKAKAQYYGAGGSSTNAETYFKKKNALYQRLNTARTSMNEASEQMAIYQARKDRKSDYEIPKAVIDAMTREQEAYDMIQADLVALDTETGLRPAYMNAAIPDPTGGTGQAPPQAPPEALQMLRDNPTPQNQAFFKETFGYLPQG